MIKVILIFCLLVPPAFSAEILVQNFDNWMWAKDTTGWDETEIDKRWRQGKRGAFVVVKPDGWNWGGRERPPEHVVIKLPGIPVDSLIKYFIPLRDTTDEMTIEINRVIEGIRDKATRVIIGAFPDVFENADVIIGTLEYVTNMVREELPATVSKGGLLGMGAEDIPNPRIVLMDSLLTIIPEPFDFPVAIHKPFLIPKAVVDSALTLKDGRLTLTKNQFEAIVSKRVLRPK